MSELSAQEITGLRGDIVELKLAIKEMSKALERLARLEEKHAGARDDLDRAFEEIRGLKAEVATLQLAASSRKSANAMLDKGIYAALGVLGAYIAKKVGLM